MWQTLNEDFHWHIEILPCLAKSLGSERSTGLPVNPTAPEEAARYLREIPIQLD
jgi:UDPglucose--hexose-1-phosphate uridylyltransferase